MDSSSVAYRLKEIINYLGLSDSQFADRCEISRPTLSLLLAGKNKKISDVLLSQIHATFPNVSILWLLFGEGEMTTQNVDETNFSNINEQNNAENLEFSYDNPQYDENSNLIAVNNLQETIKDAVGKAFETFWNNFSTDINKSNPDKKKRKVSHINVYYDDSTFETFIPEG